MILRLVEVEGRSCEARVAIALELLGETPTVIETDTLERPLELNVAQFEEGAVVVPLTAYDIKTVHIMRGKQ